MSDTHLHGPASLPRAPGATEPGLVAVAPDPPADPIHRIESFTITADSVVATAHVVVDRATRRIEIDWGDGTRDVINNRPGVSDIAPVGSNPLPAGAYSVQHAFEMPDDGFAFERIVLLRVDDADGSTDFSQHRVILTPRFEVIHYPLTVWLMEGCDPFYISDVTIKVSQVVDGTVVNRWTWTTANANTLFAQSQGLLLEGSQMRFEVERPALGQPSDGLRADFKFVESDLLTPDDRNTISLRLRFDYDVLEGDISERIDGVDDDGCKLGYAYSREVRLIVPLTPVNPGIFSPAGGPAPAPE